MNMTELERPNGIDGSPEGQRAHAAITVINCQRCGGTSDFTTNETRRCRLCGEADRIREITGLDAMIRYVTGRLRAGDTSVNVHASDYGLTLTDDGVLLNAARAAIAAAWRQSVGVCAPLPMEWKKPGDAWDILSFSYMTRWP
jgi:ribosomal protein L37E